MAKDFTKYRKEQPTRENGAKRNIDMYNIGSPYRRNTDETRLDNVEINKLVPFQGKTPFDDYIGTEKFETLVRDIEENGVFQTTVISSQNRYQRLLRNSKKRLVKLLVSSRIARKH